MTAIARAGAMLLLLACASSAAAQTPRQVLLLYSQEREFAPHLAFAQLFLPDLSRAAREPVDFIEVSLQPARASREPLAPSTVASVRARLGGRQPDLVVPIGGLAAVFARHHRADLFPTAPMLLAAVDRRFVESENHRLDTAVAVDHEPARLIENILQLLPDTRHVLVVVGASQHELGWLAELQRLFHRFEPRVTFSWTSTLSFQDIKSRSASLPPQSAILYATLLLDAAGVPLVDDRALRELHAVANAPLFGVRSTHLGLGIVGGPLLSMEQLSEQSVSAALRMLAGEMPGSIATPVQLLSAPVFDGRELRRWGIDEARLPPGSAVAHREATVWQQVTLPVLGFRTLTAIQAVALVALVASLTRLRRAERPLRESEAHLRLMLSEAPAMLWSSGPDRRITDVNRPMREFTGQPLDAHLGANWVTLVHPDDRARIEQTYHDAFARREPFRLEARVRRHDGEYRWLLDVGVPRFAAGRFSGYVGSVMDITDLHSARTALSGLSRRLMQDQEAERLRVAKTLQDDLCQRMTALTMRLSEGAQGDDAVEMRQRVSGLSHEFGRVAAELFVLSDQLHSSNLELLGLVAAARIYCEDLSASHDIHVDFLDEGVPSDIRGGVALAIYRVMQEALRNAVRHAGVHSVTVSLRGGHGEIHLKVADQGCGFDPDAAARGNRVGLVGMRERLKLVGGECTIDSHPGAGTQVRARAPLLVPAASHDD